MSDSLPVILNVYIISKNTFIETLGIDIYHTAIEYDNTEYAFGHIENPDMCGIYDIQPMSYDNGNFIESIKLGNIKRREFFVTLDKIKCKYLGKSYNILLKNCNHFTKDFLKILLNVDIPKKFTSFLKFGEFLRFVLNE